MSLIEVFDGELEKIRLQKLLMLLSKFQQKPSFDFIPYKYGCFSFQANADLNTMCKYQQVTHDNNIWKKTDKESYIKSLRKSDLQALSNLKKIYGKKTSNELLKITYTRYPYYAINSIILDKVLDEEQIQKVKEAKENFTTKSLFTIGYEGLTLESYLNKLLKHSVKVLVDVRKNSISMKYGFSKNQLEKACEGVNIKYYHLPDLGIESDKRKELNTQEDYDELFKEYKIFNLENTKYSQMEIYKLVVKNGRVALTCFEADVCQCHRKPLAEAISMLPNFTFELKHI